MCALVRRLEEEEPILGRVRLGEDWLLVWVMVMGGSRLLMTKSRVRILLQFEQNFGTKKEEIYQTTNRQLSVGPFLLKNNKMFST